jgi:hypothetical protein
MAQPIYKLFMMRYTPDWFALTSEERQALGGKIEASRKAVGCEVMAMAASLDEKWHGWGVEKYPSIEAVAQHAMTMYMIHWYKYVESETFLGVDIPPEMFKV